jgi:hypothetical protein
MDPNVGGFDRKARLVVGPVLLLVGLASFAGVLELGLAGTVGVLVAGTLLVAGVILSVTGATQKCPANEMAGLDTTE